MTTAFVIAQILFDAVIVVTLILHDHPLHRGKR